MTNWEKFKEVFGIPEDSEIKVEGDICNIIDCTGIFSCTQCPIEKAHMNNFDFWESEYEVKENDC